MPQNATLNDIMAALDRIDESKASNVALEGERLARIEERLDRILEDLAEAKIINKRFERLEQRGLGWLAGVAVAGGAIGATVKAFWTQLFPG